MSYLINLGSWQSVFAVPSNIVDKHMKLAGSAQLKTILYILRNSGEPFDAELLGEKIGIDSGDAQDALDYWVNCGLLQKNGEIILPQSRDEATTEMPVKKTEPEATVVAAASISTTPVKTAPISKAVLKGREHCRYSYSECAEKMEQNPELSLMLRTLETVLGKQLNHTEISVFVSLVEWYGMPTACVCLLVEYCRSIGKGTINYIEATGEEWAHEELLTVELVVEKIKRCKAVNSAWGHIRELFEIPKRAATEAEKKYSNLWVNEWSINDELIMLAYERCVERKGKLSFQYMRGIIEKWHNAGIVTLEQAKAESKPASAAAKKGGMCESSYNVDEAEAAMDDWQED